MAAQIISDRVHQLIKYGLGVFYTISRKWNQTE